MIYARSSDDPEDRRKHGHLTGFIVEKMAPGFSVEKINEIIGFENIQNGVLNFNDVRVPTENRIGEEGQGWRVMTTGLNFERTLIAAQTLGWQYELLRNVVPYTQRRVQFGRPISQFQGLRWMIADMATQIEGARLLTFNAAAMKDRGENFTEAASMAKLFASEMANTVAYQALQIHGGYGYIKEYPVERYYRDARVFTIYEGTSEIQRRVIANQVMSRLR